MADRRLPSPLFPWVFAFLMGGVMTAVITASLLFANDTQLVRGPAAWLGNWLLAWLIATPAIVLVAPRARSLASRVAVPPTLGQGHKARERHPASIGAAVQPASARRKKTPVAPASHAPPHRRGKQRNRKASK